MQHSKGSWAALSDKRDRDGRRWHFSYWSTYSFRSEVRAQRLFFWDDKHQDCGVVILQGEQTRPWSAIDDLVTKLAADPKLRKSYSRELRFPLERFYAEFGSFPEEVRGEEC